MVVFTAPLARAQVSATQQEIDSLSAQIQDMTKVLGDQQKHIDTLERELAELRDKVNTPVVNDYANRGDLRSLVEQVQEVDRKRKEDSDMIAKQIEKIENLVKTAAVIPPPPHSRSNSSTSNPDDSANSNVTEKGYEYVVKQGDTLGLILKAYREKGVKVSLAQIKAANPKMNPEVLIPGKKIFIPDASAK